MNFITCETMRRLVLLAVMLLGVGILLFAGTEGVAALHVSLFSLAISYIGLALLLASPLVMVFILVLSLLPGASRKLEHCNH